jgi:hypothetical protein
MTRGLIECLKRCVEHSICVSANYAAANQTEGISTCELNSAKVRDRCLVSRTGASYYELRIEKVQFDSNDTTLLHQNRNTSSNTKKFKFCAGLKGCYTLFRDIRPLFTNSLYGFVYFVQQFFEQGFTIDVNCSEFSRFDIPN